MFAIGLEQYFFKVDEVLPSLIVGDLIKTETKNNVVFSIITPLDVQKNLVNLNDFMSEKRKFAGKISTYIKY